MCVCNDHAMSVLGMAEKRGDFLGQYKYDPNT